MALQGTLDTFALPDVLRLLATTRKTGRLLVHGNRGDGNVWVDAGAVIAASATGLPTGSGSGDVIFELLRHTEGAFTFEAGSTPNEVGAPAEVEPLLQAAERQLLEWKDIEAVVPSLDAWVSLAPELPGAEAVIDKARWRTIVAVGSGTTVRAIADVLELGEVPVSRLVKELVELGYAAVVAAAPSSIESIAPLGSYADLASSNGKGLDLSIDLGPFADDSHTPAAAAEPTPVVSSVDAFAIDIPGVDPIGAAPTLLPPPPTTPLPPPPVVAMAATSPAPTKDLAAPADADDAIAADEVARQLASLSPKAARAVAAAAKATTPEERDAALAEVGEDAEEPINRGLLLKFLSSVRS